jgi:replicative DNA helicase
MKTIDKIFNVAEKFKPNQEVYPLSIDEFDEALDGGFRDGELIVVSGQTGQGKTTFAQILTKNFHDVGVPSLWFSYEMNPWYLKEKFVSMGCQKDLLAYSPIDMASSALQFIDKTIKEGIETEATKIVFIDHLHYLVPLEQSTSSSLMIGGIVRELKKMAVSNNVVIVLIAHTKKIYQDEELSLSSIRDSSLIAQEADYVFLVERLKAEKKKLSGKTTQWLNQTKVQVAKNRRTGNMMYVIFEFINNNLIPIHKDNEEQVYAAESGSSWNDLVNEL